MTFPGSVQDLEGLVSSMRRLGVVSAFGVVLGPEPTRAEDLARAASAAGDTERPKMTQELAEELRRVRIERAREDMRDTLAATGRDYSDEDIDRLLDPSVFAEAA